MLDKTTELLEQMGAEYVRKIKLELGVVRQRRSKVTGKLYKARYNDTGNLSNSVKYDIEQGEDGIELDINALDYFDEVVFGTPRKAKSGNLASWIEGKPVRLRTNGQFIAMTPARVQGFSEFLSNKISMIGSDLPSDGKPFMDEINEAVQGKYIDELPSAIVVDVAKGIGDIFKKL